MFRYGGFNVCWRGIGFALKIQPAMKREGDKATLSVVKFLVECVFAVVPFHNFSYCLG